jgi:hypothetical protein
VTTQINKENRQQDFTDELASMLPPERVERADRKAQKEIFQIRLAELRKHMGLRQEDVSVFSQSAISKLESRKDIKISTLIEYLDNIGMGIEIRVYPKDKASTMEEDMILLKI